MKVEPKQAALVYASRHCRDRLHTGASRLLVEASAVESVPAAAYDYVLVYSHENGAFRVRGAGETEDLPPADEPGLLTEPVSTANHILALNPALSAMRRRAWAEYSLAADALPETLGFGHFLFSHPQAAVSVFETPKPLGESELLVLLLSLAIEREAANRALAVDTLKQAAALRREVEDLHWTAGDLAAHLKAAKLSGLQLSHEIPPDDGQKWLAPEGAVTVEQFLGVATRGFAAVELYFGDPGVAAANERLTIDLVAEENGAVVASWQVPLASAAPGWHCFAARQALAGPRYGARLRIACPLGKVGILGLGRQSLLAAPALANGQAQGAALAMRVWLDLPGARVLDDGGRLAGVGSYDLPINQANAVSRVRLAATPSLTVSFPLLQTIDTGTFQLHPLRDNVIAAALPLEGLLPGGVVRTAAISVRSANPLGAALVVGIGLASNIDRLGGTNLEPETSFDSFSGWRELQPLESVRLETAGARGEASHIIFLVKLHDGAVSHQYCWTHWSKLAATCASGWPKLHVAD